MQIVFYFLIRSRNQTGQVLGVRSASDELSGEWPEACGHHSHLVPAADLEKHDSQFADCYLSKDDF